MSDMLDNPNKNKERKMIQLREEADYQRKVHNEILKALHNLPRQSDGDFTVDMKSITEAIVAGEIPYVRIEY